MAMPSTPAQLRLLSRFGVTRCVDVHCHCLPNIDDGPGSREEAVALCRALADDGLTTVIATPHQLGRYDRKNLAGPIRDAVIRLQSALDEQQIPLCVLPGADVRVDERIPPMLDADGVLTLGDRGSHLLIELPHDTFIDPAPLIRLLAGRGIRAVMSHPERHAYLRRDLRTVKQWVQQGALLQVTAGSLTGDFGTAAEEYGWSLIASGLAGMVATDAHDTRRRPPRFTAALQAVADRFGDSIAMRVCFEGPRRVLDPQVTPRAGPNGSHPSADKAAHRYKWSRGARPTRE